MDPDPALTAALGALAGAVMVAVEDRRRAQASKLEAAELARLAVIAGGRRAEDTGGEAPGCRRCRVRREMRQERLERDLAADYEDRWPSDQLDDDEAQPRCQADGE